VGGQHHAPAALSHSRSRYIGSPSRHLSGFFVYLRKISHFTLFHSYHPYCFPLRSDNLNQPLLSIPSYMRWTLPHLPSSDFHFPPGGPFPPLQELQAAVQISIRFCGGRPYSSEPTRFLYLSHSEPQHMSQHQQDRLEGRICIKPKPKNPVWLYVSRAHTQIQCQLPSCLVPNCSPTLPLNQPV
jgi:hypothetical protein